MRDKQKEQERERERERERALHEGHEENGNTAQGWHSALAAAFMVVSFLPVAPPSVSVLYFSLSL